jgi:lysylphosphatidylglycerol synthetase-like protein (DUF2156 family)
MSYPNAFPQPYSGADQTHVEVREQVALGLAAALVAVVLGAVLTVVVWRAGFVASITSFVLAAGAVALYTKAAGSAPRKGLLPLILLIIAGVVLSFLAIVGSDLADYYDHFAPAGSMSKAAFIRGHLVDADVLGSYGKEIGMFALFAGLGLFSTLRRLLAAR